MSSTLEILASDLHGTVAGYRAGCKGSMCAAAVPCRDVYRRYVGDFAFARRVDAGESPAAIIAEEEAEVEAVRARDKAAVRAERVAAARATRPPKPSRAAGAPRAPRAAPSRRPRAVEQHGADIARLHAGGLLDTEIASLLGIDRWTVGRLRRELGLEANRAARPERPASSGGRAERVARLRALHDAGFTDQQIADELDTTSSAVAQTRRRLGLRVNRVHVERAPRAPRAARADYRPRIVELHGEGLTDRQIAERLELSLARTATLRRELSLPANRGASRRRVDVQPHGTNACYARGCRRPECIEAHREYHRAYVRRRRQEGAREYHGTAYGYQLGCHDRATCPSTPSCADASLAAEEARRRAAGIEPKVLVDATPAQAHIRDLIHAGMRVDDIAAASGLTFAIVRKMIHSRGKGRGIVSTVLAERASAILAVPMPIGDAR